MAADTGVLAYVFWHAPPAGADVAAYEDALGAFHAVLADDRPEGFLGSRALRVAGAPWLPGRAGYEDWYLVSAFGDLGALNDAAVSGRRRPPHDDVAGRSAHGAGGVYALWAGAPDVPTGTVTWFAKSAGVPYGRVRADLEAAGGTTWQRQLVLGPAPELCRPGGGPLPAGTAVAATTEATSLWPTPPPATPGGP